MGAGIFLFLALVAAAALASLAHSLRTGLAHWRAIVAELQTMEPRR